jgi:hypothetical protein
MKRLLLLILLISPMAVLAQDLVEFENGQVADADDMNANFQTLDERLTNIEDQAAQIEYSELNGLVGGWQVITVDCSEDSTALSNERVLQGSDRLRIKLFGTCELSQDFLITGQKLMLDGGDLDSGGSECATKASVRFPDQGDNQSLRFTLNSSSVLYLKCVTLEARDGVQLSAYSNSYIRTEYGVTAPSGGIAVSVSANSLFRTFYPISVTVLSIQRASSAEVYAGAGAELGSVFVSQSSDFICRVCPTSSIESLTLTESSSAYVRSFGTLVRIGTLSARQGSSFIFQDDDCDSLSIETLSLLSNSMIYQGYDGDLSCESAG